VLFKLADDRRGFFDIGGDFIVWPLVAKPVTLAKPP